MLPMFLPRAVVCVCALLPLCAAQAEIVLDAPVAPAPVRDPATAAAAQVEVPVAKPAPETPPAPLRQSAGAFSDRLKLKDGRELTGNFVAWSAQAGVGWRRRAFPRPVLFPLDQVVRVELNQTVPKAGAIEPQLVVFVDGSGLPGKVVEFSADKIVMETWFAGQVTADGKAVRRFGPMEKKQITPEEEERQAMEAFENANSPEARAKAIRRLQEARNRQWSKPQKNKPVPPPEKLAPGMHRVRLANGDEIHCSEFSIQGGKARIKTNVGPLEIPIERIASCIWSDADAGKAPPHAPGVRAVQLNGPQGGTLLLRIEKITDGKLVGTGDSLGKLEISLDAVAAIE